MRNSDTANNASLNNSVLPTPQFEVGELDWSALSPDLNPHPAPLG